MWPFSSGTSDTLATTQRTVRRVYQSEIFALIQLYETDDFFDFWADNVAKGWTDAEKLVFKRYFPTGNFLKRLIQRMAYSIPPYALQFSTPDGDDLSDEEEAKLEDWVEKKFERRVWEGESKFDQAMTFWREMVFLTGRLVVKHYTEDVAEDGDQVGDACVQRMPQTGIDYQVDPKDRKRIVKWSFRYMVDGGTGELLKQSIPVHETIDAKESTREIQGSGDIQKVTQPDGIDFIPVSYLAWETLEAEPLGKPYGSRILKKILNVLSILTDMRNANRKNSDPMKVFINADIPQGTTFGGGAVVSVKARTAGQQVDVKNLGGNLTLEALFKELQNAMHDLYEDAQLPFPGRDEFTVAPNNSGKALQMLSAQMIAYREKYEMAEAGFIEDMVYKMASIDGLKLERTQVHCIHEPLTKPTASDQILEAGFFESAGFMEEALRRMGCDDAKIVQLMKEKAATDAIKNAAQIKMFGGAHQGEIDPKTGKPVPAPPPATPPPATPPKA